MWTVLRARWKAILGVPALLLVTFCYVTWTVTIEGIEYAYRIPKQYELGGSGVLSWLYGASAGDLEGFDTGSSTHIAIPEVEVKELGATYSIRMLFSLDRAYESISGKNRFLNSPIRRGYDWVHGDSVRYPHFVKRIGGTLTRYYFSEEFPADEPGLQDAGRFNARIVEPSSLSDLAIDFV